MGIVANIIKRLNPSRGQVAPFIPTLRDWIDATVTPADLARRFGPLPKAVTLLKYFVSCTEASTCAMLNARYLAQFEPRMYRRGSAKKSPFKMRQKRVTDRAVLKHLKDANPQTGAGSVARYASNAGDDDIYEVVDHPFLRLCGTPNPFESSFLHRQMSHLQRQIFGNSYRVVFMGDDGYPDEMRHMAGQHMRIVPGKDNLIESFEYKVLGNAPDYYDPSVIAHLKSATSYVDYFYGCSWMERCATDMDLLISGKLVEKHRFENGLRAEFAVLMPEFNPVQKEAMREEVTSKGTGVRNSGGFLIMPGASSIMPITLNNRDMQYSEGMKRAAETVRFCAGVPEAIATINSSNLAGGLLADGVYKQLTIQPELCNDAQQMTMLLNRWYDHEEGDVWMAYDEIVNIGAEENAKAATMIWEKNGLTLNEYREALKYDPMTDERGNLLFAEVSSRGAAAQSAPGSNVNTPSGELNAARTNLGVEKPKAEENNYAKEAEVYVELPPRPKALPAPEPVVVKMSEWRMEHKHKTDAWEYPFTREAYSDVYKGVEAWYIDGVRAGQFDSKKLESALDPLRAIFQEGGQDGIATLMSVAGGAERVAELGVSFDVLTEEVLHYFDVKRIRLAHELSADKNAALVDAIRESIKGGMNTQEATKAVQEAMGGDSKWEAERIARDQSARAYTFGNNKAWADAKVPRKQWLVAGGACEVCLKIAELNAEPIATEENFYNLGDSILVNGKRYVFDYEPVSGPPAHPCCRCTLIPVLQ